MYRRTTRRRNKAGSVVAYSQLAETRGDPVTRRPTAQIIHTFGRADTLDREALVRLARSITRVCHGGLEGPEAAALPGAARALAWARPLGVVHGARARWAELGIGAVRRGWERPGPRCAPPELALFTLVATRLAEPLATLACDAHWGPARVYLPAAAALTLEPLDFAVDVLDTPLDASECAIFFRIADRFRADVDLVCWATTTVAFEIDEDDAGDETRRGTTRPPLRKRGDRQEGRDHPPPGVVGLALTRDGLPVRSWGCPGHTGAATTVAQVTAGLRGWRLGPAICGGAAGRDAEANRPEWATGLGRDILAMPMGQRAAGQPEGLSRPGRCRQVNEHLAVKAVVGGAGARRRR